MEQQALQTEAIDYSYRHKKFDTTRPSETSTWQEYDFRSAAWLTPATSSDTPSNLMDGNNSESNCSADFEAFHQKRSSQNNTSTPISTSHVSVFHFQPSGSGVACGYVPSAAQQSSTSASGSHLDSNSASDGLTWTALKLPPGLNKALVSEVCKYHGNMVRKFPKKIRSQRDQERRDKNTVACRLSRRAKKIAGLAIEEEYKRVAQEHEQLVEKHLRMSLLYNKLKKLLNSTQPVAPKQDENQDSEMPQAAQSDVDIDDPLSDASINP